MNPRDRAWLLGAGSLGLAWYASDSLRHRREGGKGYTLEGELDVGSPEFMRAAEALTGAPISQGNEVELLINGDQIFPAFLETIRNTERTLNLVSYAYWRGDITERVAEAVCERAQSGVRCNIIVDAVGALKMNWGLVRKMDGAGATVIRFRPPKPYAIRRLANRNHRKIMVSDGHVGMTGGVGIAEEWTGNAEDPDHWRDTHVRVRGPVVRGLQGAFAENWLEATGEVLTSDDYLPDLEPVDGSAPMQVIRSSAGVGDTNAEALFFLAVACAKQSIELTSAYFVPRPAFTEALVAAAKRGVELRILVPGPHIDKQVVRVAGRSSYDELLSAGARIYEYQQTMLHAKTLVIDDTWASVGSINFDNRSFQLHDEANLCVQDPRFALELKQVFERDLTVSEELDLERWRSRPRGQELSETATRLLRREL